MSNQIIVTFVFLFSVAAFFMLVKFTTNKYSATIKELEKEGYKTLDKIIDGQRWTGTNLKLIHSKILPEGVDGIAFREQLCRSSEGNFILLKVTIEVRNKRVLIEKASPINEREAARWMQPYSEAYIATFGQIKNG